MNISDLTKMQQEPVSKKGIPLKTITWRNNKNILQISQPDLPINVQRKSDSLGEANFMFVMHILENKYGLKTNMVAINLLRVG
jgi:hypothetical protein